MDGAARKPQELLSRRQGQPVSRARVSIRLVGCAPPSLLSEMGCFQKQSCDEDQA